MHNRFSFPYSRRARSRLASMRSAVATGAIIRHGGTMVYYAPGPDVIQLPVPETFRDAESYAATKAHELTHWTKHPACEFCESSGRPHEFYGCRGRPNNTSKHS